MRPLPLLCLLLAPAAAAQEISWVDTLDGALARAGDRPASVLVYCWKDGDDLCASFWQDTMQDPKVLKALDAFICVSAQQGLEAGDELHDRFGVTELPAVVVLDGKGRVEDKLFGYWPPGPFVGELERIGRGEGTVGELRRISEENPDDLMARYRLARKLADVGEQEACDELYASIRADDPRGRSEALAHIELEEIVAATLKPDAQPGDIDLGPLVDFLAGQKKHEAVQFKGYDVVARVEYARGNIEAASVAVKRAWDAVPDDRIIEFGQRVLNGAWKNRKELDRAQRRLALTIAHAVAEQAREEAKAQGEAGNTQLAFRLYSLGCAYYMNNQRQRAFDTLERCIELDPDSETYPEVLAAWKRGVK